MPDNNDLLLQDVGLAPTDEAVATIAALAQQLLELQTQAAIKADELATIEGNIRRLQDVALPEAMDAAGVEEMKLSTGAKLAVESDLSISVPKARLPQITDWLKQHGHGDIIKREFSAQIPKGPQAIALEVKVADALHKLKLDFAITPSVHSGTLKALLKEQLAKGANVDLKLFGAYKWKKATITLPK